MHDQMVGSRLGRMLPALLAWILLLAITSCFFIFVMPGFVAEFEMLGLLLFGLEFILSLSVATNFVMAAFMDPGIIPNSDIVQAETADDFRTPLYKNVDIKGINVRLKWCISCHIYRPPRSSHCAVCNQCIEMFDHHCPWVNNCIGRRNYRQFFLFLVSLVVHMVLVFCICLTYCIRTKNFFATKANIAAAVVMVICAVFFLPIFGLTIFHTLLIFRARTTNEQVTGRFRGSNNPFTRGYLCNGFNLLCSPQRPSYKSITRPCNSECQKSSASKALSFPVWDRNHNNRNSHDLNIRSEKNVNNRLKRRLQPAISMSGNVYALNENGIAELIHLPSSALIDEEEASSNGKPFDTIVTQAKDKIVASLSRSSSQITIDDPLFATNNRLAAPRKRTRTNSGSNCNLLDSRASERINNQRQTLPDDEADSC